MLRINRLALTGLLTVNLAPTYAAGDPGIQTSVNRFATIFLAEIKSAEPLEACEKHGPGGFTLGTPCRTRVRVQVVRILKGGDHQAQGPAEFDAELLRETAPRFDRRIWAGREIRSGLRYLIFSGPGTGLAAMFESPAGWWPVTDEDDAVGDVDLILNSASRTLQEQVLAVANAIGTPGRPHSHYLVGLALALAGAASETETAGMVHAIENSADSAFSDFAKAGLLQGMWLQLKGRDRPPESLLRAFAALTQRYLVTAPDSPRPGIPDVRDEIMRNSVPWIVSSEHATAVFRAGLRPAFAEQFLKKASELAAEDRRFAPEQRADLRRLIGIAASQ